MKSIYHICPASLQRKIAARAPRQRSLSIWAATAPRSRDRRYLDEIENRRRDISWLMKTETLQDSLESYRAKLQGQQRTAAALYDLALKAEHHNQPGDQISCYVTGARAKVKIGEHCRLATRRDAVHPDENAEHYMAKLKDLYD